MNQILGWILIVMGVTGMIVSGRRIYYALEYIYYDKYRGKGFWNGVVRFLFK